MRPVILWFGIVVLPFVVYAQSLGNDFVTWDDRLLIVDNPIVHGLSWQNIVAAFTSYDPELYIPMTLLSYQMNYVVGGLNPFGYHFMNLVLHVANAVFVFAIAKQIMNAKSIKDKAKNNVSIMLSALCIALLFVVHPLHTEAVVWAAARKDVLSTFFFLLTVLLYVRSRDRAPKNGYANHLYVVSVVMFLFALLSKVSVITWPLLLPILDWYLDAPRAGTLRQRSGQGRVAGSLQRAIPYAILSLIFGIVALGGKIANTGFLYEKLLIGCRAVTLLLQKFFFPVHLSALYPFTKPISLMTPEIGLSVLFVLFVFFVLFWLVWKKGIRLPLFSWVWFLLFLAPSMSNILKGHNELLDIYVTSDRYAYLPSIGLLLACPELCRRVTRLHEQFSKITVLSVFFVFFVLFVFSFLSYRQSLTWKNTLALFTHVSEVQPHSYVAWTNIGTELVHRGRLNEGLQAYGKALAIRDDATTWYNVGQILRAQGKIELAIEAYEKAVESSPLEKDAKRALEELRMEN